MRTLLETPDLRDETTFVRWMQLGRWHADLRIPVAARGASTVTQQGFCGVTQVTRVEASELCTWHRLVDYQPPGPNPDVGLMVFESPDCVIETGVHGAYREIWHRLPNSTGRLIALAEPERADGLASARLFIAGQYLMRVRPRCQSGPDFEISFGPIESGHWHLQQSTRPEMERQSLAFSLHRSETKKAQIEGDLAAVDWDILEWTDA